MSVGEIVSLMRDGIFQVFILIAPALISALIVVLIVAIFQAVSSIQEQTLTFLPKLLIILAVLALLSGWMFTELGEYTINLMKKIPDIAK